jgi:ribosomal protein S18 acetylase RimI-like enzyme
VTAFDILRADLDDPRHQAAIVELLDSYSRDPFGEGKPLEPEARERLIPGLKAHGGAVVLLAYEQGQPVGLALCLLGFSSFRGRPLLNIHDLAVRPEARGRGVGRQLLEALEVEARRLGCCKLTLEVRSDNTRAMELYRKVGFEPGEPPTWFWTRKLD